MTVKAVLFVWRIDRDNDKLMTAMVVVNHSWLILALISFHMCTPENEGVVLISFS